MFDRFKKKQKTSLGRVGRVEREQRMVKTVRYITIAIISIVILVTVGGVILNSLIYPNQPIVTVNGQEISTKDFKTRVQIDRDNLLLQYEQILNAYYNAQDATLQETYANYLNQIVAQMEPETVGQSIMSQMIDEVLLIQYAQDQDIEVTEDEVTEYMQEIFGYYPDGAPEPTETTAPEPTSTLSAEQLEMITPTPSPTPMEETEDSAAEPTQVALDTTAPASITEEEYQDAINNYLDSINEWGGDEELLRHFVRVQLYTDKINAELRKGISVREEQVWARHILVDDEETAQDLIDQINNGEADFGILASTVSTDTGSAANNGDLGWFTRDQMVTPFADAAFEGEVGEIVGPVESEFGFHIIQILGHENRPLTPNQLSTRVQVAYSDLMNSLYLEADIVYADNWMDRIPTKPDIYDIEVQ